MMITEEHRLHESRFDEADLQEVFKDTGPPFGLDLKIMNSVRTADEKRKERLAETRYYLAVVLACLGMICIAAYFLRGELAATFSSLTGIFDGIRISGITGTYIAAATAVLILLLGDTLLRRRFFRKNNRYDAGNLRLKNH